MIKRLATHRSGTGQKTLAFFFDYFSIVSADILTPAFDQV
jgi:hypothetical protein